MNLKRLKTIAVTTFIRQNKHHEFSVLGHTLAVVKEVIKARDWKFLASAFYHDIGKPIVAYQKNSDKKNGWYSFTNHEDASYRVVKNWWFLSDFTKDVIRYHYLIRDIELGKIKGNGRDILKQPIWDSLEDDMQKHIAQFMVYDDLGKGGYVRENMLKKLDEEKSK